MAKAAIDYRFERKFFVSELTRHEVEAIINLHPAIFSEIYHERFINNIYFDSFQMNSYFDNIDGFKKRIKARIRWFGNLFGLVDNPVLELKIKDGLLGTKERYPLVPFVLNEHFKHDIAVNTFKESKIPDRLRIDLISLDAVLLNCYKRRYFLSADKKYRITLDSEVMYYSIGNLYNFFVHKLIDYRNIIIELKYNQEDDHHAKWITNHFPFRMTKSSKYTSGIDTLYTW